MPRRQIFGDNWEEVINEKGSSKAGGRRWNGIEETKKRWQRPCSEGNGLI
jgi:hypothetical protein